MREIQVAENKTLKLTNVLARKIDASELGNLGVILTQMQISHPKSQSMTFTTFMPS